MKRILASAVGGAAALTVIFGAGPASADNEYKGQTYANVQERTKGRAVIASRIGSYLQTEECIVTGNRRATYGTGQTKILVNLNCNDPKSAGGDGRDHPGYSVASPEGRRMADLKETAQRISAGYAKAIDAGTAPACEARMRSCQRICAESGACSAELRQYLGL